MTTTNPPLPSKMVERALTAHGEPVMGARTWTTRERGRMEAALSAVGVDKLIEALREATEMLRDEADMADDFKGQRFKSGYVRNRVAEFTAILAAAENGGGE